MVRILHFSDVHLRVPLGSIPLRAWLGKRLLGGANLYLGRGRHYGDAARKVAALDRLRREEAIDFVLSTGDFTNFGVEAELRQARAAIEPLRAAPSGYVNVPGNHDVYVLDTVRERCFLRHFADTLATDRPDVRVGNTPWPLVRFVGEDVAVVAVDSTRPNPLLWRSSGKVPTDQLEALQGLLAEEALRERFVFVMTHYAPRRPDGSPDKRTHRMVNAEDFLAVCADLPRGAILCGHIHYCFRVVVDGVRPPIFCAGSATKDGGEGLWVFDVDGDKTEARRGRWVGDHWELDGPLAP